MLIINSLNTNPYFNIASEEHFLKSFTDDIFLLYRNKPSVIVGKHQNIAAEVNQKFLFEQNIPLIRRLSGGGTVYHDLGNINFTFILNGEKGKLVDFKKYTAPIIALLHKLRIKANLGERNNIFIDGLKISGNAEHIYKNRVLHHGTLLFDTDLENLQKSIDQDDSSYKDKAVKSVRAKVTNIAEHLPNQLNINEFCQKLTDHIKMGFKSSIYMLTDHDKKKIDELIEDKYSTWDWNYGYSPVYELSKEKKINKKKLRIACKVEKGKITQLDLDGDLFASNEKKLILDHLIGEKHTYSCIKTVIENLSIKNPLKKHLLDNLF